VAISEQVDRTSSVWRVGAGPLTLSPCPSDTENRREDELASPLVYNVLGDCPAGIRLGEGTYGAL
jgi:hypothetical protein